MKRIICLCLFFVTILVNLSSCEYVVGVVLSGIILGQYNEYEENEGLKLQEQLLGEWFDGEGNYIRYTRRYTDFDNTKYNAYFLTNLTTSMNPDENYYFYFEYERILGHDEHPLIVGYRHKTTRKETKNFEILFYDRCMSVKNLIDGKTYVMHKNQEYAGVIKDYSKTAYTGIINTLATIYQESLVIEDCCVDRNGLIIVNVNIDGVEKTYMIYKENGKYVYEETYYLADNNVDTEELNQKIQEYLSK